MRFSLLSIKCSASLPSFRLQPLGHGNQIIEHSSDNKTVLDSSWKLGGAAEHVIDSSEKHICQLWIEFLSLHVIQIRSNRSLLLYQDYLVIL